MSWHEDLGLARRGPREHQQRDIAADKQHEQNTQQVAPEDEGAGWAWTVSLISK
jgi:hypothetical protein